MKVLTLGTPRLLSRQDDHSDPGGGDILLVLEVSVARDEYFEARIESVLQKLAVG